MAKIKKHKRIKRVEEAKRQWALQHICSNCGTHGLHFVVPSFGEPGFFWCGYSSE